jgi:hypothetical protein
MGLKALATGTASITGGSGAFDTLSLNGLGAVTSGTYTPTLTAVSNVAASTAYACQYMRVGNVVTVSGIADIDPTTGTTTTRIGISLPVASNFTGQQNLGGTGAGGTPPTMYGNLRGDTTNDRADLYFTSDAGAANTTWLFHFTYVVM